MLIWHRLGILAIVIPIVNFVLIQLTVESIWGGGYYQQVRWPGYLAVVLSAFLVGFFGILLNVGKSNAGQKHRFFWVPLEYWSIVVLVLGLVVVSNTIR